MSVLCSTELIVAKAQLYEINGFDSRLTVVVLMSVSKAPALCLQCFDQRPQEARHPAVSTRSKVVFDSRFVGPFVARVILLFAQK